ncbi:MAG: glycosyltransferase family 1 protein [Planctomycetes bacterium]|nr:glycosyltransferase family 1 protein [Planctomycetota bacterium]
MKRDERTRPEIPKIAFVGSRGIPAKYGGNEVFLEAISDRLLKTGFDIYITCESSNFHTDEYHGIKRIYIPVIDGKTITIPALKQIIATFYLLLKYPSIDVIYYLTAGAAFAAPIPRLLGKKIIINTDGIEWKRLPKRKSFASIPWKPIYTVTGWGLKVSEWFAVKLAHTVIADSMAIKAHLEKSYNAQNITYASYGARDLIKTDVSAQREQEVLSQFNLASNEYYLSVARIVAENNIHMKVRGFASSKSSKKLVIVGNFNTKDSYNKHLFGLKDGNVDIQFLDPIYNEEILGILRKNCSAYLHAYEIGGTNPSLLEQMLFKPPILAYDVPFHREVLQDGGIYFNNVEELAVCIQKLEQGEYDIDQLNTQRSHRLNEEYNWDHAAKKYEKLLRDILGQ